VSTTSDVLKWIIANFNALNKIRFKRIYCTGMANFAAIWLAKCKENLLHHYFATERQARLIRETSIVDIIKVRFIFVFDVADRARIQKQTCILCVVVNSIRSTACQPASAGLPTCVDVENSSVM